MPSLTQNGFGAWLLQHSIDEVVGYPEDPRDCPLCRYLRSLGVPDPFVHMTYYRPVAEKVYAVPLAEWASKFQYDAMDLVGMKTDEIRPITALQAINAMNTDFGKRAFRNV
jgi:hypothetical protein